MHKSVGVLVVGMMLVAAGATTAAGAAEWTLAVFLNADNNLDGYGAKDLQEMVDAPANGAVRVVVQIDRRGAPAQRVFCKGDGVTEVDELGEVDMGDVGELRRFLQWTVERHPAEQYAVVVWNHGSGWEEKDGLVPVRRGISYDEQSGHHITVVELAALCHEFKAMVGHNLEILAMDACLMQMVEVVYGLEGAVDYVVASEEGVPGDGYPYGDVVALFRPGVVPQDLACGWARVFLAYYGDLFAGTNKRSTQSVVEVAKVRPLVEAMTEFSGIVQAGVQADGQVDVLKASLEGAVKFLTFGRTNVDIGHLMELLARDLPEGPLLEASRSIAKRLGECVVLSGHGGDPELAAVRGLAVYWPRKPVSYMHKYAYLPWCAETGWNKMIYRYFKQTGWPWVGKSAALPPSADGAKRREQARARVRAALLQGVGAER